MMRAHSPPDAGDGSVDHMADPSPSDHHGRSRSHLRLVWSRADVSARPAPDDRAFGLVQRHLSLANRLGVAPLTVAERAESLLRAACEGWRSNGYCMSPTSIPLDQPHPECVLAQYHHDLLLLEHDLLEGGGERVGEVSAGATGRDPRRGQQTLGEPAPWTAR